MNNTWKLLGGVGAAILLVRQFVNLLWSAYSNGLEYWDTMSFVWTILSLLGFGLISAGFFMATTSGAVSDTNNSTTANKPTFNDGEIPTVGNWLGWQLILAIPFVGFVFLIIWAIDKTNPIRRNWILANLILLGIVIAFYIVLMVLFMASTNYY